MKHLSVFFLCLTFFSIYGQEATTRFDGHNWEAPYHLSTSKGWTVERFLMPISFAPQIPYKGVEDIRFTPGWGNVEAADYWSYAFLWWLEGSPVINAKTIAANLKAYYTGLMKVNTDSSRLNALPETLKTVNTAFKATATAKGDRGTYKGTVEMLDYMRLNPVKLNCIVHVRSCPPENKTIVFHELSPQPFGHNVWGGLEKLWLEFSCKK
jgi:hypothetical protein